MQEPGRQGWPVLALLLRALAVEQMQGQPGEEKGVFFSAAVGFSGMSCSMPGGCHVFCPVLKFKHHQRH